MQHWVTTQVFPLQKHPPLTYGAAVLTQPEEGGGKCLNRPDIFYPAEGSSKHAKRQLIAEVYCVVIYVVRYSFYTAFNINKQYYYLFTEIC